MAEIRTYEEMNKQIKGILRMNKENLAGIYAALRIEELEKKESELREELVKMRAEVVKLLLNL